MKVMYRTIIFILGILLAAECYFAKSHWKTRKRFNKRVKKLQNKAGNMLNKAYFQWR